MPKMSFTRAFAASMALAGLLATAGPAQAQYRQKIANDMARCRGEGPPGYRIGRHIRYRRAAVEAWLETQTDHQHMRDADYGPR